MTPQMPARGGLLLRLGIAAVAGAFLVFCVVLPAEYRKDPTGFGRLTGLLELSTPRAPATPATSPGAAPSQNSWLYPAPYKSETIQIPIGPDGELEYKFTMKQGQAIVYSWQTDQGTVYYDFHGHPPDNPNAAQSYAVQGGNPEEQVRSAHGAFVAPVDGIHGWYWVNLTSSRMVITLQVSGYYESHDYIR